MGRKPQKRDRHICFWCHQSVPIKDDMALFKHRYAGRVCTGSGKDIVSNSVRYWEVREAQQFINDLMRRRSV